MLNLQIVGSEKILDFNLDIHLFFQKKKKNLKMSLQLCTWLFFEYWILRADWFLTSFEMSGAWQACKYYAQFIA